MVIGRLAYSRRPAAPLIATEDILPDTEIHFDTLAERLPEPLSRCGLMPGPLSRIQLIFPQPVPETFLNPLYDATWPTRLAPEGN